MEGFDIRTLALTNLLLGMFLGVGSLVFARIHTSFSCFKPLGYSYLLFSLGFILLGLRQHIPDFLSIVAANGIIAVAFSLLVLAILNFLKYEKALFEKLTLLLLPLMLIGFIYFTYIQNSVNARIIIISTVLCGLSLFAGLKILTNKGRVELTLAPFLGVLFVFSSFVFFARIILSFNGSEIEDFMDAGFIHGFSLIALQFITVTSCFSLTISASQQLAKKLAVQATIDSLTDIYNRRAFDELAVKEVFRAQREITPISLILMDIDLFKKVNDNYGHQVGDKVLQEFSLRLQRSLRQYDILARYGGEEFVLLLPDSDSETATIIAEKLRTTIAYPIFLLDDGTQLHITASFGVATNQGEHIKWEQLMSLADKALYQAKESGRNRVILHSAKVFQLPIIEKIH